MGNIKAAADLAKQYDIPLFFDPCRFAENAKFIQDFETGYQGRGIPQIFQEMFAIGQFKIFAEGLVAKGIPVILPTGGHAIYLDMDGFFAGCRRSYGEFASVGFTLELLKDYGIRACEAGPFGWEWDKKGSIT
ncbi:Tryptophanase [Colletotrichum sp. SAR11_239]|nr:Tryptophanase [Colletotrichum sp. SAR11_239]